MTDVRKLAHDLAALAEQTILDDPSAISDSELRSLIALPASPFWPALSKIVARLQSRAIAKVLHEETPDREAQWNRGRISSLNDVVQVLETGASEALERRKAKLEGAREGGRKAKR